MLPVACSCDSRPIVMTGTIISATKTIVWNIPAMSAMAWGVVTVSAKISPQTPR
jgi:hypothetical protein